MLTDDSMDDSLIEQRQKENKELRQQRDTLISELDALKKQLKSQAETISVIQSENDELKKKLLVYEHDPIIYEESINGFIIKVWDKESDMYKTFAQFYDIDFEEDLEEFCKEFVIELKDAYMVE